MPSQRRGGSLSAGADPFEAPDLWTVRIGGQPHAAALAALANGQLGVVGDVGPDGVRATFVAGAYGTGPDGMVRPLPGPTWTGVGGHGTSWQLDMRAGTLRRRNEQGRTDLERFVSIVRPTVGVLLAAGADGDAWPSPLAAPEVPRAMAADHAWTMTAETDGTFVGTVHGARDAIVAMARQRVDRTQLERVVAMDHGPDAEPEVRRALEEALELGGSALLEEHREAWARRWADADIEIAGDPRAQLAVRFALFHLLSCARTDGQSAVGARGLTGLAYAGHVFWDTDVFVLPTLAATLPDAARSVLEYRLRRLPAARARARDGGGAGARFPWESADTGEDVTPRFGRDLDGALVPITTGELSAHINADVAWAADHYVAWTGDETFVAQGGRELIVETATDWAQRVRVGADGRAHLDDVTGPDEYHERVDDDAYTNLMARWHLTRAADLTVDGDGEPGADAFRELAGALVDGRRPDGHHEEFAGFDELDDVDLGSIGPLPVAADVVLGRERTAGTKVLKQPDVLMAHHLLGDLLPHASLLADLDAELPRISHGSSLSPAICAAVLARAGRADDALALFHLAGRLDLDDLTGSTSAGLHLATMGGVWQAVVFGFAGIRPGAEELQLDPRLPSGWRSLRIQLRFRGQVVRVHIDHEHVSVATAAPVPVRLAGELVQAPFCRRMHEEAKT